MMEGDTSLTARKPRQLDKHRVSSRPDLCDGREDAPRLRRRRRNGLRAAREIDAPTISYRRSDEDDLKRRAAEAGDRGYISRQIGVEAVVERGAPNHRCRLMKEIRAKYCPLSETRAHACERVTNQSWRLERGVGDRSRSARDLGEASVMGLVDIARDSRARRDDVGRSATRRRSTLRVCRLARGLEELARPLPLAESLRGLERSWRVLSPAGPIRRRCDDSPQVTATICRALIVHRGFRIRGAVQREHVERQTVRVVWHCQPRRRRSPSACRSTGT